MPRKAFIADVTAAADKAIPKISGVVRGDDDGDVNFVFSPASGPPIELSVLALDVSGYPAENTFMIFARSSDLPKGVEPALEDLASYSAGSSITELLNTISERLQKVLATGSAGDPFSIDDVSDTEMLDGDREEESEEEEEYYDDYSDLEDGPRTATTSTYRHNPQNAATLNRRIKEDLRAVRFAGFKLGILSGLKAESQTSLLSISIQASKLGLSEEALQAWDLEPNQYIVLLIRYSDGYKTFESIIADPAKSHDVAFRIGVSNKYKPTNAEALAAFTDISKNANKTANDEKLEGSQKAAVAGFTSLFISSSLNEFVNIQFISLLKIRYGMGIGWDGAKRFFNE
jgi:ubiquitin-conjugating enzyme E2 Q